MLIILCSACAPTANQILEACQPPEYLSETDLVGIWAYRRFGDVDTLVIREDGLYQQTLEISSIGRYVSEWLPWKLEVNQSGTAYLMLEGFNICMFSGAKDCSSFEQGESAGSVMWDTCAQTSFVAENVAPLVIIPVPKRFVQPPRGFTLHAMQTLTESDIVSYELIEP